MNKLVFQIGVLVFCVSVVYFGTQGLDAIQTVSRSFMVFMVVVSGMAVVAMVVATSVRNKRRDAQQQEEPPVTRHGRESAQGPMADSRATS